MTTKTTEPVWSVSAVTPADPVKCDITLATFEQMKDLFGCHPFSHDTSEASTHLAWATGIGREYSVFAPNPNLPYDPDNPHYGFYVLAVYAGPRRDTWPVLYFHGGATGQNWKAAMDFVTEETTRDVAGESGELDGEDEF